MFLLKPQKQGREATKNVISPSQALRVLSQGSRGRAWQPVMSRSAEDGRAVLRKLLAGMMGSQMD